MVRPLFSDTFFYALDPFVNLPTDRMVMVDEVVNEADWLKSAICPLLLPHLKCAVRLRSAQSSRRRA